MIAKPSLGSRRLLSSLTIAFACGGGLLAGVAGVSPAGAASVHAAHHQQRNFLPSQRFHILPDPTCPTCYKMGAHRLAIAPIDVHVR
jgi:hypothetical protein